MAYGKVGLDQAMAVNVDFSLVRYCGIHMEAVLKRVPKLLFCVMNL